MLALLVSRRIPLWSVSNRWYLYRPSMALLVSLNEAECLMPTYRAVKVYKPSLNSSIRQLVLSLLLDIAPLFL